jgi:hypothetical protein
MENIFNVLVNLGLSDIIEDVLDRFHIMIHYKQLSFIFLSSSLEQHAQIASDALEFAKPNQSHVQSNF